MNIDLTREMIVWHACPSAVLESIKREGLRVMRESIYVGIHPGIPIAFGRKFYDGGYVLFTLRLAHADWTWGIYNGYEMTVHEGMLRRDVSKDEIVEILSEDEVEARLHSRDAHAGRLFGSVLQLYGYDRWLNQQQLIVSCRKTFASAPSFRYALAGLYVTRLDDDNPTELVTETADAMLRLLNADCALPTGAVQVALSVLERCDRNALGDCVARILVDVPDERLYLSYLRLAAEQKTHLIDVLRSRRPAMAKGLMRMTQIMSGDGVAVLSKHHADMLARCVVFGISFNATARRIIAALGDAPGDVSNDALLYLLRYIRQVPSRSRQMVVTALRARRETLMVQIEEVARLCQGRPQHSAERILSWKS